MEKFIRIRGTPANNLKNIDFDLPSDKLIVITSLSGMLSLKLNVKESAMHAIEFETDIENGMIRIPDIYRNLHKAHARIIVLTYETSPATTPVVFNPRAFFGVGRQSKLNIDTCLSEAW
ncbi:hypothetical protein [Thiothrix sp.]|jgi:hypothetical protein|uniref:hypothetical protein n=1 Tax=Thiothrix sp. TaxID=1032 RepID=UPI00257AEBA3|nr:hypothetical protein [Thiothrix sp.]